MHAKQNTNNPTLMHQHNNCKGSKRPIQTTNLIWRQNVEGIGAASWKMSVTWGSLKRASKSSLNLVFQSGSLKSMAVVHLGVESWLLNCAETPTLLQTLVDFNVWRIGEEWEYPYEQRVEEEVIRPWRVMLLGVITWDMVHMKQGNCDQRSQRVINVVDENARNRTEQNRRERGCGLWNRWGTAFLEWLQGVFLSLNRSIRGWFAPCGDVNDITWNEREPFQQWMANCYVKLWDCTMYGAGPCCCVRKNLLLSYMETRKFCYFSLFSFAPKQINFPVRCAPVCFVCFDFWFWFVFFFSVTFIFVFKVNSNMVFNELWIKMILESYPWKKFINDYFII